MDNIHLTQNFPTELILDIISFLSYHDLLNFRLTSSSINNVGLYYLRSMNNLISAFWNVCQRQNWQWIDTNSSNLLSLNLGDDKIEFFHHSLNSIPFVIRTKTMCIIRTHLQLSFDKQTKKLIIRFDDSSRTFTKFYDFNICAFVDLNRQIGHDYHFNCYKPEDHSFYFALKNGVIKYHYKVNDETYRLEISPSTFMRFLMVNKLTQRIYKIVFEHGIYLILVKINFEFLVVKEKVYLHENGDDETCLFQNVRYYMGNFEPIKVKQIDPDIFRCRFYLTPNKS